MSAASDGASFTYVLPLVANDPFTADEFVLYLGHLGQRCEVIVVDGSCPDVFAAHARAWGAMTCHVPPDPAAPAGKVGGVLTGVALASHDRIVIADDDVRYGPELHDLVARLDDADLVRPQNYFDPLPWHAVWDSGRSLLNRIGGGDWPGTLAVRRSTLRRAGGYAGDVLFENFELAKTIEAVGGSHVVAKDVFVRRLPPTTQHFLSQRVRQAYDELARPARLVPFLAVLPAAGVLAATGRWPVLRTAALLGSLGVVAAAELGRRTDQARTRFPLRCSLAAPLWVGERSVCVWAALAARARGGVRYRGMRVRRAALRAGERRRRVTVATA